MESEEIVQSFNILSEKIKATKVNNPCKTSSRRHTHQTLIKPKAAAFILLSSSPLREWRWKRGKHKEVFDKRQVVHTVFENLFK